MLLIWGCQNEAHRQHKTGWKRKPCYMQRAAFPACAKGWGGRSMQRIMANDEARTACHLRSMGVEQGNLSLVCKGLNWCEYLELVGIPSCQSSDNRTDCSGSWIKFAKTYELFGLDTRTLEDDFESDGDVCKSDSLHFVVNKDSNLQNTIICCIRPLWL